MKKTIRLTESDLSNIIQEAVTEIGGTFPAQENEFKQDRADLLRIWKHLKEFCKYSDSTEYDEGDKYREALEICIKSIEHAMNVLDKTVLFTTDNYSEFPNHWGVDRIEGFNKELDESISCAIRKYLK